MRFTSISRSSRLGGEKLLVDTIGIPWRLRSNCVSNCLNGFGWPCGCDRPAKNKYEDSLHVVFWLKKNGILNVSLPLERILALRLHIRHGKLCHRHQCIDTSQHHWFLHLNFLFRLLCQLLVRKFYFPFRSCTFAFVCVCVNKIHGMIRKIKFECY